LSQKQKKDLQNLAQKFQALQSNHVLRVVSCFKPHPVDRAMCTERERL